MMISKRKQSTTMLKYSSNIKIKCFLTWREKMRLIGFRPRKLCSIIIWSVSSKKLT